MFCLVLQCEALQQDIFRSIASFLVIHLKDLGLLFRKTLLHCKYYIVAIAK